MAAPGVSGITPKPTPGPSRAVSPTPSEDEGEGSEGSTAAAEETERYVVKSLDMEVTEGGKNFSAGACALCRPSHCSQTDTASAMQVSVNFSPSLVAPSSSSRRASSSSTSRPQVSTMPPTSASSRRSVTRCRTPPSFALPVRLSLPFCLDGAQDLTTDWPFRRPSAHHHRLHQSPRARPRRRCRVRHAGEPARARRECVLGAVPQVGRVRPAEGDGRQGGQGGEVERSSEYLLHL